MTTALGTKSVRSLTDLVTKGTTPTSIGRRFTSRGVRFIKVETIGTDGTYIASKGAFIDAETHQVLRRSQLRAGDILFSIAGALGRSTIVDATWLPANTNQAFAIIRPAKNAEVLGRYLLWALRSDAIRTLIGEINVQAAQANLSLAQVRNFEIPVPGIEDQEWIAAVLDDADSLVRLVQRAIAKMRAIKQGVAQQLLTGEVRLPGFDGRWPTYRLSDVLSYEQPGHYVVQTPQQLDAGMIPVLTAGKTFVLGYTNERHGVYTSHPVIIFDDFTTASKYVNFDFKVKSSAMKILSARPGVDIRFIYERMQLIDFPLGDHKRYWISEYSKQEIEVPGTDEQRAISGVVTDFDAEIELLERRLVKARLVMTGMMQKLLTGRTRLRTEGAAV